MELARTDAPRNRLSKFTANSDVLTAILVVGIPVFMVLPLPSFVVGRS